jgi:hypothetical protein
MPSAIETLKQELLKVQQAQSNCIEECGLVKTFKRSEYQILTQTANDLKGSIDWLSKMYEGKEVINNK